MEVPVDSNMVQWASPYQMDSNVVQASPWDLLSLLIMLATSQMYSHMVQYLSGLQKASQLRSR